MKKKALTNVLVKRKMNEELSMSSFLQKKKKIKLNKQNEQQVEQRNMVHDPVSRLEAILPRLEKLLSDSETPLARAERENNEYMRRYKDYPNDFDSFLHSSDPIEFNNDEGKVYCKMCHFYAISHTISKKGDRFYVNHNSPCSYPLTGRGFHKYGKGSARKAFFEAHHDSKSMQYSEYRWACGFLYDKELYSPKSFLKDHNFHRHIESSFHMKALE